MVRYLSWMRVLIPDFHWFPVQIIIRICLGFDSPDIIFLIFATHEAASGIAIYYAIAGYLIVILLDDVSGIRDQDASLHFSAVLHDSHSPSHGSTCIVVFAPGNIPESAFSISSHIEWALQTGMFFGTTR